MLRQISLILTTAVMLATPATAQRTFEIPGIGTIQFGAGQQKREFIDRSYVDKRFKVLDRKRNYNDERRVVFDVGRDQGRFSQLRIRAVGKVVRIVGLEVVFGNGKSQKLEIYEPIYPGQVSPALDLTGDARGIRRVILTKRRTWQRERGEIELLGLPDKTGDYKLVGTETHRNRDRDIVFDDIKKRRGGYDKIRLRALTQSVRVTTIEVTFGNRDRQVIRYYKTLRPGNLSEPLDLDGQGRNIRTIVVNKRFSWNNSNRGRLDLFGLPGKAKPKINYTVLGTERTGRRSEDVVFDNIDQRRRWDDIRIKALDRAIRIEDVVVVFGNGKRQRVDIGGQRLRPGEATRVIPLDGRNARHIRRIRVGVSRRRGPRGRLQVVGQGPRGVANRPRPPRRATETRVPDGWVLFGSDTVGTRAERQVLPIGKDAGVFDRITFRALRNDIHIRDVTIVYGNGSRDRRNIDLLVPAGYGTPPIDLKTGRNAGRYIREIIVTYRAEGRRWGNNTALLQVFGEYSERWLNRKRPKQADQWILLGARKAAMFSKDNDSILVGKRFGRFRAVKVRVRRKKVKLYGMTITYENGTTEAVPVYGKLSAGLSTKPFDLKGRKRFIRRVDLRYRTKFNFGGDGIVEVWGLR